MPLPNFLSITNLLVFSKTSPKRTIGQEHFSRRREKYFSHLVMSRWGQVLAAFLWWLLTIGCSNHLSTTIIATNTATTTTTMPPPLPPLPPLPPPVTIGWSHYLSTTPGCSWRHLPRIHHIDIRNSLNTGFTAEEFHFSLTHICSDCFKIDKEFETKQINGIYFLFPLLLST